MNESVCKLIAAFVVDLCITSMEKKNKHALIDTVESFNQDRTTL